MMKWGGRKQPSSSSSSSSSSWPRSQSPSISHAFPISWLSKLKQIGGNSERKPTKEKQKGRVNSESPSMACPTSGQDGRFYAGEDDSYWRLSFGEDKFEGERHRKGMKSVLYGSGDDVGLPFLDRQKCNSIAAEAAAGEEEIWKFNDMVLEARKMGELPRNVEITTEIETCEKEAKQRVGKELNKPRRKAAKHQKLRKIGRRVAGEKGTDQEREPDKADQKIKIPVERDLSEPELKPMKTIQTSERDYQQATASDSRKHRHVSGMDSSNSNVGTIAADSPLEARNMGKTIAKFEKHSPEWQNGEEGRASMYISRKSQRRTKQSGNAGASSPRTATKIECKIKAIEDMKKAKIKMKKKSKSRAVEDRTGTVFDSFAVVKCSFDPQQDFKDSMVAMITEKGIEQPELLEELLACYLTLNSDEYHDLIIKVFRQVWFDLNGVNFGPELYHQHCCQA